MARSATPAAIRVLRPLVFSTESLPADVVGEK
jgi:hypothetical protein